jgi:hypothetical protein
VFSAPFFPIGSTVPRFIRPLVITVVSLGLALGASVGLAAPAGATTTGFTGAVTNYVTSAADADVQFSGMKDVGSTFSTISIVNNDTEIPVYSATDSADVSDPAVCSGLDAASSDWSCVWTPNDGSPLADGGEGGNAKSFIRFAQENSDATVSQDVLTFDVWDPYEEGDEPTAYPVQDFQFVPGGVASTTTPGGENLFVGTSFYQVVPGDDESFTYVAGCPAGVNDNSDGGFTDAVSHTSTTQTCTTALDSDFYEPNGDEAYYNPDSGGYDQSVEPVWTAFTIPVAPVAGSVTLNANKSITIAGTGGIDGQALDVIRDGNASDVLCRVPNVGRDGSWSCTTAALPNGSYVMSAVNEDVDSNYSTGLDDSSVYLRGGLSAATSVGTLRVGPAPSTGGTTTDITPVWSFTVSGDLTDLHPGDTITVTGSGLPAGTSLDVVLHSTPTDLGTVVAAADGTFTQTDTIPQGVDLGAHTIQVTASGPGLVTTVQNQAITVTAKPASGSGGKTNPVAPKPTATHGNGGSANGAGIAPNILTRALTPLADVAVHPNKIVSAFEIGLVLLLLAVLPAHLLNATIAEQSDRFERRFGKIKTPNWLFSLGVWFKSAPVVGGIIVTLATAILFGFADPKFGFTLASLRLILACGIALFLVGYVANALTGFVARVQWNIVAAVSTRPYGLILTIVGVLISRFLHFSPGFLIGLILGLTIQGKSASGFAWRTVVLRSSIVLVMAIAAWIGYSTLTLGGNEGGTFWSALLVETLVAITTEGVVALLVELLPLRFLEGERVYAHSRVLWGIFYFLTLVVFVLAVVPWEGNWDALHGSLWIWIVVLAAFALVCVGIYVYFRRFAPPLEEEAGNEKVALGETVSGDRS